MKFSITALCSLVALNVFAQTKDVSTPPQGVPLRPVISNGAFQPDVETSEISLTWNEKSKTGVYVAFTNAGETDLKVLGVQSSPGLFVVDFPDKVKAGAKDRIDVIYEAENNADGGTEVIRIKTDHGIRTLHVKVNRNAAVTFDKRELKWSVGSTAEAKTVTIKVIGGISLKAAKATAGGHKAEIETVDSSTYRLKVTPGATNKASQFAVRLDFDQAILGVAPVIFGVVGE